MTASAGPGGGRAERMTRYRVARQVWRWGDEPTADSLALLPVALRSRPHRMARPGFRNVDPAVAAAATPLPGTVVVGWGYCSRGVW